MLLSFLLPALVLGGCGLSEPEIPRVLYFDPPNERIQGDPNRVFADHQYIVKLRPDGYDPSERQRYIGDFMYYRNHAWNPDGEVIYVYKVNYKPSQTWLMSISVPHGELEAVSQLPKDRRGSNYSPLFAYDGINNVLATVDAQGPCGGRLKSVWNVYDIDSDTWDEHALDGYAFTTLDFDPSSGNYVGVGFRRGGERIVATLDVAGNVITELEGDLCAVLEPRQHGFEQNFFRSQIVDGIVHIYRHLYYGRHAEGDRYWERQHYTVNIATGVTERR